MGCSMEKHQLTGRAHVFDTPQFAALPAADQQRVANEVETFVRHYRVPASTPEEIVREVLSDRGDSSAAMVRYVQIDVESMDRDILLALPFGKMDFLPKVVLWEGCFDEEFDILRRHGYATCCCVNIFGANSLAY